MREDGTLGTAKFHDAKGGSPFYIAFLHHQPDTFVIGYAVGDGVSVGKIDANGKITTNPPVKIDTSAGQPSSCAGWPCRPTTGPCTRRTSVTATSARITSTAKGSSSRRIRRARRFREMARSGAQWSRQQRLERPVRLVDDASFEASVDLVEVGAVANPVSLGPLLTTPLSALNVPSPGTFAHAGSFASSSPLPLM